VQPTDLPPTELESMNRDHRDQVEMLRAVVDALDALDDSEPRRRALDEALEDFAVHTREHFRQEDDQMRRYHFPAFDLHRESHAMAIARMDTVLARWRVDGDRDALGSYFRTEFPAWLAHHVGSMDVICAQFVAGRAH